MVLVVTASASTAGNPPWIYLTGTIQEVIDELQNQNVSAGKVVYYVDDTTDAKALFCRMG
ncbi:hypothetical protein LCGC14_2683690 [marine sediment metagenome]|uniref:Uncharacterized protein n=1 Tax=marine sediment metagenome TaxID=412755 RepID=A0A0F9CCD6_9ZZZZ